ncbi:MAG TPA: uracil-DNA glycosylase family protein [Acetobacteraceae bacterium]|nr:uracil-DNA glycosylase family protein [Acetobacteraceae bacterium]
MSCSCAGRGTEVTAAAFARLAAEARACTLCAAHLPLGPRPLLRGSASARLLVISQAPGTEAHRTGLSFNDRSGDRLRDWLGLDRGRFYDEAVVAIMPMGFCYPGRAPRGGDRPPRRECAPLWHDRLRAVLPRVELTLLVGSYAIRYYLPQERAQTMAATLRRWRDFLPGTFVLPHPSWRAALWLRSNAWFAEEALPELRRRVAEVTG